MRCQRDDDSNRMFAGRASKYPMHYPGQSGGHSSNVRGWLVIGERRLTPGQVGPGFCILKNPAESEVTEAELVIEVDDVTRVKKVYIPDGIRADSTTISFS